MKVEATVDVGDNITGMLEKLASQLGTTADQVFPWYVAQAHLEGITTLCALAISLFVFTFAFGLSVTKAYEKQDGPSVPIAAISGFLLVFTCVGVLLEGVDAVRKVNNPNYYAMKMMTQDIGRMVRR